MRSDAARPLLLVEDNAFDADLLRRAYEKRRLPYPLEVVADGERALAHLEAWEAGAQLPVMILLDLHLPRVSGLEVLRRLKSHACCRAVPVIALTTSDDPDDLRSAYALGVNSYLVKPADFARYEALAELLEAYWLNLNLLPEA